MKPQVPQQEDSAAPSSLPVPWKVHRWVLAVSGVPGLGLATYLLYSALTDTSELAAGVFIFGLIFAAIWAIFAACASVLFALTRKAGAAAVVLGYLAALVPVGMILSRLSR